MKSADLHTKIFLDSGDPSETKQALELLGFLDGQTTNPTLIAKNPMVKEQLAQGKKYTKEEIYDFYKKVVQQISALIPQGSVSIEVYADMNTKAEEMFAQGKEMFSWIPNAHIKYPTTTAGLQAAEMSVKEGLRVNMTLCFTQAQAAAVYAATRGAEKGDVFVSPFIGRLDDIGQNGMDFIKNTIQMYKNGDGHVEVLTASVRTFDHFMAALQLGTDIQTVPFKVLQEWKARDFIIPHNFNYQPNLTPILYENLDLNRNWNDYDIKSPLTDQGIEKFVKDWNSLIL